jgi:hypothetical protein
MVIKEFIQILRDTRMKAIVFVIPVLQTLVFGFAVTTDVNNVPTAVVDLDKSSESRELARRFEASGYFHIRVMPESPEQVQELLDRSTVTVALQVNPRFGMDLSRRIPTSVQLLADGTDSNTAMVALDYANRIIKQYAQDLENAQTLLSARVDVRQRAWYNPELKSKNYNVPGVIAMVIMLTSLLLTSMAVVREREMGTMEQLMVTPLKPVELILGKTIQYPRKRPVTASSAFHGHLSPVSARYWTIYIHHCKNAAAGADGYVSFLHACGPSLRIHVPHREYASDVPVRHLCQPTPVFSGHYQRYIPEGERDCHSLAPDGRTLPPRDWCVCAQFLPIQKASCVTHINL